MNAEETIYRRRFKFKNNKGKRINLDEEMKNHLYRAAIIEMKKIEEQFQENTLTPAMYQSKRMELERWVS